MYAPSSQLACLRPPRGDRCENCGSTSLQAFEVPGQTLLWKCRTCDLYQQGRLPDEEAYENEYHEDYQRALSRKIRTAQVRLCRVSTFLEESAPDLLDIGCSIGATVTAAQRRGWSARGVDVSQTAVDICRRQGLDCRRYDGQRLPFKDESFDVLTSWHVIEHVANVTETLAEWLRSPPPGRRPDTGDASRKMLEGAFAGPPLPQVLAGRASVYLYSRQLAAIRPPRPVRYPGDSPGRNADQRGTDNLRLRHCPSILLGGQSLNGFLQIISNHCPSTTTPRRPQHPVGHRAPSTTAPRRPEHGLKDRTLPDRHDTSPETETLGKR